MTHRNSQRSGLGGRARLGDVDSSHRGSLVAAGLGSFQQGSEVTLQVRRVVLAGLSVHTHGSILAGPLVRLEQPVGVDEVGQRRQAHLGTLPSELGDPLLFRGHVHGFRCTRHVSLQRCHDTASPSLGEVPRDGSPASSVLWDAPTPQGPSRRASLPSLGDTIVCVGFAPGDRDARSWASGSYRFRSPDPE
jgi:hypothetical protein